MGNARSGFASMDREKQRDLASRGGRAAQALGLAHRWTSEEAKAMGRKGGLAAAQKKRDWLLGRTPRG